MNTLPSQQIAFLSGLGLFLLISLPLDYYILVQTHGKNLAKRLMPNTVFASVLIVLVFCLIFIFVSSNTEAYLSITFLGIAALLWGRVIVLLFKRSTKSRVLLDLGPASRVSSGLILFFTALGLGLILLALWVKHAYYVFWGLMMLAQAAWHFMRNREHALITDRGLQISSNAIQWARIKSYEWANELKGEALLVIQLHKRPKPFDIQVLQIPAVHKEETNCLLVEHTQAQA